MAANSALSRSLWQIEALHSLNLHDSFEFRQGSDVRALLNSIMIRSRSLAVSAREHHSACHSLACTPLNASCHVFVECTTGAPKVFISETFLLLSGTSDLQCMGHDVSHALQVLKARAGTKEQVCHLGIEFLTPFVACYFLVSARSGIPWRLLLPSVARD